MTCCLSKTGFLWSLIWTLTTNLTVLVSVIPCLPSTFLISSLSASKRPILKRKYDRATPTLVKASYTSYQLDLPTHLSPSLIIVLILMFRSQLYFDGGSTYHVFPSVETLSFSYSLPSSCLCRCTYYTFLKAHFSEYFPEVSPFFYPSLSLCFSSFLQWIFI